MRWLRTHTSKYKLLLSIIIITVINIDLYSLVSIKQVKEKSVQAEQIQTQTENLKISESESRKLKLELALRSDKDAVRFLGDKIPRISIKAVDLCDRYKEEGLTIPTLMGIMQVESGFNPRAISSAKAYGLMQVVRSTASPILKDMGYRFSVEKLLHPETNMEVGTTYLMSLHRQFMTLGLENKDEFHTSVLAYYYGEGAVISSVNKQAYVSLAYLGKVKVATRRWEQAGF